MQVKNYDFSLFFMLIHKTKNTEIHFNITYN